MKMESEAPISESIEEIHIVSREEIPAIHSVEQDGKRHDLGELRDFQWHPLLKQFMPSALQLSFSWAKLKFQEELPTHQHSIQSMMIIYQGSGQLLGDKQQAIKAGDVIIVPPDCEHGFIGGPEGLHALSIQFGEGLYTNPENPNVKFKDAQFTLEKLLQHNQYRLQKILQHPFFKILQDGTLENPKKRSAFLNHLQIWVDGNQTLLFSRQATCSDKAYQPIFLQHLHEEVGHDSLYNNRSEPAKAKDTILEAITTWFIYQMITLDNVEKAAIIHLVIENTSQRYHEIARASLAKYVHDDYFQVHEADDEHAALGPKLLQGQSSKTYLRIRDVIDEAWDMLEAMMNRVTILTVSA